ncbi:MAG: hypothetical protein WCA10_09600 [Terracidiphilus sp.]
MIRQAISCDICGTEMLNANHWFVAYDRGPELRIGVCNPGNRLRASARHLCGDKCLHKLVDVFTARTLSARASASVQAEESNRNCAPRSMASTDTSLTCVTTHKSAALPITGPYVEDFDSSARLIAPVDQRIPRATSNPATVRADAWKRERQRQPEQTTASRRSIA